jgi:glycosyltransferase involved in cell wall biosynthesis
MVKYTVAVCNYNMVDTVGTMLESVLDQIDERFEVVVVDGGSTDGSQDLLRNLSNEHSQLRVDLQDSDPNRHLGADRNRSFELAEGEYILESFDCDNQYYDIIQDLVALYHQLEDGIDSQFLLSAMGVNMAPRDLALRIPYRNLGGAEDRDWFRRLGAQNAIVFLQRVGPIKDQVGYDKSLKSEVKRDLNGKICDFRTGITLRSALRWSLYHERHFILERDRGPVLNTLKKPYDFVSHVYAYLKARSREQYPAPDEFEKKETLEKTIARNRKTLSELESELGIQVDRNRLSETGRRAFDDQY